MNTAPQNAPVAAAPAAAAATSSTLKSGAPDAVRPLDTGAVTKRLQQELMGLMAAACDGVSAFPAGDSLFDWVGTITVSPVCRPLHAETLSLPNRRRPHVPAALSPPRPRAAQGAEGTAYEGCTFRLSLKFTSEYPFKPPCVRFETPCFHPNVDAYGNICLDILKDKWSGACAA